MFADCDDIEWPEEDPCQWLHEAGRRLRQRTGAAAYELEDLIDVGLDLPNFREVSPHLPGTGGGIVTTARLHTPGPA